MSHVRRGSRAPRCRRTRSRSSRTPPTPNPRGCGATLGPTATAGSSTGPRDEDVAASARGRRLELGHDVGACQWAEVPRPDALRLELCQLPDRFARPPGVEVVGVERDARRLRPAVHVGHVDAVGDERAAVLGTPQSDLSGRVPGEVAHLEAGHPLALADRAVYANGTAVPDEAMHDA